MGIGTSELPIEDVQDLKLSFTCPVCDSSIQVTKDQLTFYNNHDDYIESCVIEVQCLECEDILRFVIN
jgi:RNase P subunit RPR2